ncbi:hypothetical protein FCM35_KLT05230 [Carex littledalei]|uniref:Uncharacterized protein n=1 Tax=Carex littledalei TaxID=544730 RepID=A0A833R5G9_9POAL|nr:hypothetical protein FCM35_KLT05230 [Carex littledalei]
MLPKEGTAADCFKWAQLGEKGKIFITNGLLFSLSPPPSKRRGDAMLVHLSAFLGMQIVQSANVTFRYDTTHHVTQVTHDPDDMTRFAYRVMTCLPSIDNETSHKLM